MRWTTLAVFGLLVACGGGGRPEGGHGGSGGPGGKDDGPPPEPLVVVEVSEVVEGSVADTLVTSAVVESESQADLFPEATGTVVEVRKEEGDVVKRGDVLAVLDNVTLDASAERASAELERVRKDYERVKTLYEQGAVSEREMTEARYQLDAARTSAREASRSYGQTRITAPFDGVVAVRDVRVGELATSGRRAFQVVDLDLLRVVASLPERDLSRVHLGQPARLVSAYDPGVFSDGAVSRIAPVVDPSSGTFRVTVRLDATQTVLRPGQYVSVQLEVDRHEQVTVIPRKALLYEDGMPVSYVMVPAPPKDEEEDEDGEGAKDEKDGGLLAKLFSGARAEDTEETDTGEAIERYVAERRLLQVGLVDAEWVEVAAGLEHGDQVVVVGQSNLRDGSKVLTPAMKAEREAKQAQRTKEKEAEAEGSSEAGSEG